MLVLSFVALMICADRLILVSNEGPVNWLGEQYVVMSTQVGVGFLAGQDEEVTVRMSTARQCSWTVDDPLKINAGEPNWEG